MELSCCFCVANKIIVYDKKVIGQIFIFVYYEYLKNKLTVLYRTIKVSRRGAFFHSGYPKFPHCSVGIRCWRRSAADSFFLAEQILVVGCYRMVDRCF